VQFVRIWSPSLVFECRMQMTANKSAVLNCFAFSFNRLFLRLAFRKSRLTCFFFLRNSAAAFFKVCTVSCGCSTGIVSIRLAIAARDDFDIIPLELMACAVPTVEQAAISSETTSTTGMAARMPLAWGIPTGSVEVAGDQSWRSHEDDVVGGVCASSYLLLLLLVECHPCFAGNHWIACQCLCHFRV